MFVFSPPWKPWAFALFLIPGLAAGEEKKKDLQFPFPAQVDAAKGKTGVFPNRIQDKNTGTWFVLVPGGTYRIGSDKLPDSKVIEVTLRPFYIAEYRMDYSQFAEIMETEFRNATDIDKGYVPITSKAFQQLLEGKGDIPPEWKNFSPKQRQDALWVTNAIWTLFKGNPWLDSEVFIPSAEMEKTIQRFVHILLKEERTIVIKSSFRGGKPLTESQRKEAREICAAFEAKFFQTMKSHRKEGNYCFLRFLPAHFGQAPALAEKMGFRLPTEAQWEAAARLHVAGKLKLQGFFDNSLEWCADFYAHDYFQRKKDFQDPKGPPRGKLNSEQMQKFSSSSGLFSGARTRKFHVLRGGDAATRHYGYYGNRSPNYKTIRLVFNPEIR